MKIIYGKDYYDFVMSYGHDDRTCFIRNNTELDVPSKNESEVSRILKIVGLKHQRPNISSYFSDGLFHRIFVIFCGKIYTGIRVHYRHKRHESENNRIVEFFWDINKFKEFINENKINKSPMINLTNEFISGKQVNQDDFDFLINNNYVILNSDPPIYLLIDNKIIINTHKLSDIKFYNVIEAHSAFQEIEMFLSAISSYAEHNLNNVPDIYRFSKKGFDKWSFRNKPKK